MKRAAEYGINYTEKEANDQLTKLMDSIPQASQSALGKLMHNSGLAAMGAAGSGGLVGAGAGGLAGAGLGALFAKPGNRGKAALNGALVGGGLGGAAGGLGGAYLGGAATGMGGAMHAYQDPQIDAILQAFRASGGNK